jgi:hypothetical protein
MLDRGYENSYGAKSNIGVSHTKAEYLPLAHAKEMQRNNVIGRSASGAVAYVYYYYISSSTRCSLLHVTTFFTRSSRSSRQFLIHNAVFYAFASLAFSNFTFPGRHAWELRHMPCLQQRVVCTISSVLTSTLASCSKSASLSFYMYSGSILFHYFSPTLSVSTVCLSLNRNAVNTRSLAVAFAG